MKYINLENISTKYLDENDWRILFSKSSIFQVFIKSIIIYDTQRFYYMKT